MSASGAVVIAAPAVLSSNESLADGQDPPVDGMKRWEDNVDEDSWRDDEDWGVDETTEFSFSRRGLSPDDVDDPNAGAWDVQILQEEKVEEARWQKELAGMAQHFQTVEVREAADELELHFEDEEDDSTNAESGSDRATAQSNAGQEEGGGSGVPRTQPEPTPGSRDVGQSGNSNGPTSVSPTLPLAHASQSAPEFGSPLSPTSPRGRSHTRVRGLTDVGHSSPSRSAGADSPVEESVGGRTYSERTNMRQRRSRWSFTAGLDPFRHSRTISLERNAAAVGLNLHSLYRLPLPVLRAEVYSLFHDLRTRYDVVCDLIEKDPVESFLTLLRSLEASLEPENPENGAAGRADASEGQGAAERTGIASSMLQSIPGSPSKKTEASPPSTTSCSSPNKLSPSRAHWPSFAPSPSASSSSSAGASSSSSSALLSPALSSSSSSNAFPGSYTRRRSRKGKTGASQTHSVTGRSGRRQPRIVGGNLKLSRSLPGNGKGDPEIEAHISRVTDYLMTINAALTQLRVKPVPEEPEVTEETEPSSGTSETDKAGEGDSGKSSTGSGGSDGGGTDQSLSVSVPPSSLAPVSSSPASATAALPPHVLEGLQAVPCVAARRELLFKCRGVVREMEEGFDPSINVSDPRYLRALPTTSSNAEGQKLLMQILLAADTLIHSEGGNRASSTRLSVKIQTISNILLECFEQQDPRWQQ